jgi:hypothetical protein
MFTDFRDLLTTISPTWFKRGIAARFLYVIALHFDALADMVDAAVRLRFPGGYGTENIPYLSRERRIRRGINEADQVFVARLRGWLDAHKDRGGPYPMLEQLYAHYRYSDQWPFKIHLIYTSGARFVLNADGSVTRDAGSFTTGLGVDDWAHWWLVYEWPDTIADDGIWDDPGTWGDGGVWDSALTPAQVTDFRLIPTEWNNGHCYGIIVVLSPGQALWDAPEEIWDSGGTWDDGTDAALVQVEIE